MAKKRRRTVRRPTTRTGPASPPHLDPHQRPLSLEEDLALTPAEEEARFNSPAARASRFALIFPRRLAELAGALPTLPPLPAAQDAQTWQPVDGGNAMWRDFTAQDRAEPPGAWTARNIQRVLDSAKHHADAGEEVAAWSALAEAKAQISKHEDLLQRLRGTVRIDELEGRAEYEARRRDKAEAEVARLRPSARRNLVGLSELRDFRSKQSRQLHLAIAQEAARLRKKYQKANKTVLARWIQKGPLKPTWQQSPRKPATPLSVSAIRKLL